jgi:thiaminase
MNTDKKKYMELMQESMNDIENMLMKAQEDICAKLGITQEILEKSEMCLMERGLG